MQNISKLLTFAGKRCCIKISLPLGNREQVVVCNAGRKVKGTGIAVSYNSRHFPWRNERRQNLPSDDILKGITFSTGLLYIRF